METQNETKAKEIAKKNQMVFYVVGNSYKECYESAMAMARWKDEVHAEDKQQLIDEAAEWLRMTMDFFNNGKFNTEKFVNYFKQTMKGE